MVLNDRGLGLTRQKKGILQESLFSFNQCFIIYYKYTWSLQNRNASQCSLVFPISCKPPEVFKFFIKLA